jgi:hypothetical protein
MSFQFDSPQHKTTARFADKRFEPSVNDERPDRSGRSF